MTILIGYVPTPEGWAALDAAMREATWRGVAVAVLNIAVGGNYADDTFADEKDLDPVRARLTEAGLPHTVEQVLQATNVADEILKQAEKLDAELIVLGIRHRAPLAAALLGSTTRDVILATRCPVLTVPPNAE